MLSRIVAGDDESGAESGKFENVWDWAEICTQLVVGVQKKQVIKFL